ncbi:MAG: phytoene desaturase [Opitutaceae bacterium]|nr:phytoene desaturase [Cytophagales bacterium]
MSKAAIVIGAGIGGIAVAIRLAVKGYQVTVFEANDYSGGKLSEITFDGYRFDAGPSLFTLPELVDELFTIAGKDPRHYLKYQKLDEICKYFYEDGTHIRAYSDPEKFSLEIEKQTKVKSGTVRDHLLKSKRMYELTDKLFLQSSLHKFNSYLNRHSLNAFLHLGKLKTNQIMHEVNQKQFEDPKITQLFDRYATYNGSNPYKSPATLNIIPHLEYNLGAYFPTEGMYSITKSLVKLAEEIGVVFKYNSPVKEIRIENNSVVGIIQNEKFIEANIVVSNVDISNTYRHLLKSQKAPEKLLSQEKSSSGLVFYWGIDKNFSNLGLHNIFFSNDYKEEFESIFNKNEVSSDPTIYLNISSKHKPDDAPQGHENWFTMINVPYNSGQDWDRIIDESRQNIIKKLNRLLGQDISVHIKCEQILDPRSIEQKTGSAMGALYGNSSNDKFAAFLRHPNFSSKIKNLYFCGGSVHPGGGIPLCLFSAKIVSGLVK